jgi:hypothetical protein
MSTIAIWMRNMTEPLILIDLNIILDILGRREPFYEYSAAVMSLVEKGTVQGCVAAHSVTTLFYIVERMLRSRQ